MPCYVTGSARGDAELLAEEAQDRATELTRLLCSMCAKAELAHFGMPRDVARWWRAHKEIDALSRGKRRK